MAGIPGQHGNAARPPQPSCRLTVRCVAARQPRLSSRMWQNARRVDPAVMLLCQIVMVLSVCLS